MTSVYFIDLNTILVTFRESERERMVVGTLYVKTVLILEVAGLTLAWGRGYGHTYVKDMKLDAMNFLIAGFAMKSRGIKTDNFKEPDYLANASQIGACIK